MPGEEENRSLGQTLPPTQEERLTAQFYDWERRGRGWQIWNYPVGLEPPFRPFFYHYVVPSPAIDDSRKPTALSSFMDRLLGRTSVPTSPATFVEERESDPKPLFEERTIRGMNRSAYLTFVQSRMTFPAWPEVIASKPCSNAS